MAPTSSIDGNHARLEEEVYFENRPPGLQPHGHYPQDQFQDDYQDELMDPSTTDTPGPAVIVRGEEIGIVIVVLLLWVGAIALFFNRWGKIRMLEPYQPKFCESHRPSCPIADVPPISHFPRSLSKFNINLSTDASPHFAKCTYNNYNYHPIGNPGRYNGGGGSTTGNTSPFPSTSTAGYPNNNQQILTSSSPVNCQYHFPPSSSSANYHQYHQYQQRPRQNSVFTTAIPMNPHTKNTSRKTKSAVDLSNLILAEDFIETVRRNSKNSITHL